MTASSGQVTPPSTREALRQFGFKIGEFSYGVPTIWWWNEPATLVIGNFCSFANGIEIFLGGNHRVDWVTTYPFSKIHHHVLCLCSRADREERMRYYEQLRPGGSLRWLDEIS